MFNKKQQHIYVVHICILSCTVQAYMVWSEIIF